MPQVKVMRFSRFAPRVYALACFSGRCARRPLVGPLFCGECAARAALCSCLTLLHLQAEARAQADAQRYWELLVNLGVEPPPPPAPQTQGGRTDGDVSWVEEAVDERQCALSADAPSHVDGRSAHRPECAPPPNPHLLGHSLDSALRP